MIQSINPTNGNIIWEGPKASTQDLENTINLANKAFASWSQLDITKRQGYLFEFAKIVQDKKNDLARHISEEMGKPYWDALTEVQSVINKVSISIEAHNTRCREFVGGAAITRFKPHATVAAFGTFNFPMHIGNGHIVPALLAGNTVIFKPSNYTPKCGEIYVQLWKEAGLPEGVLNILQGDQELGQNLVKHPGINGVYFTGSVQAGISINKTLAEHPEKIIALELGGNNPLVVHETADLKAAAYTTILSAYITNGQRCTCARRLIIPKGDAGDQFLKTLTQVISTLKIGDPLDKNTFMGPVISKESAQHIVNAQQKLQQAGGQSLIELKHLDRNTGFVSPGLIDVTSIAQREDQEIFGPLLQVLRVQNINEAFEEANNTRFGLSASILTDNPELYRQFHKSVHAGLINWNQQTTGASPAVPFGGIGLSGNHRPAGLFAADYCSYPVASIEQSHLSLPETLVPGISV